MGGSLPLSESLNLLPQDKYSRSLLLNQAHKCILHGNCITKQSAVLKWVQDSPRPAVWSCWGELQCLDFHLSSGMRLGSVPKVLVGQAAHGDATRVYFVCNLWMLPLHKNLYSIYPLVLVWQFHPVLLISKRTLFPWKARKHTMRATLAPVPALLMPSPVALNNPLWSLLLSTLSHSKVVCEA